MTIIQVEYEAVVDLNAMILMLTHF